MSGGLLVAGTTSDAGKSVLTAGICRWLRRRGVRVAPFKAQNMSNNSAVVVGPDGRGGELGRAQAMQAAACGLDADLRFNPVLLKPGSDHASQVVLLGEAVDTVTAGNYHEVRSRLATTAYAALAELRSEYDVVICEGAGSPAEINLRDGDYVNMGLARQAGLPTIVVGDIDRGGVFASMFGTVALLDAADQALLAGFVVNKFRGDRGLLQPGLDMLRRVTGRPTYGVVPWALDLWLDAEDSLAYGRVLGRPPAPRGTDWLDVAVVRLPRISNATDVEALATEPGVRVRLTVEPAELAAADLVVLPGTKSTVADLAWLRRPAWPTRSGRTPPPDGRCSASAAASRCWAGRSTMRWRAAGAPYPASGCCPSRSPSSPARRSAGPRAPPPATCRSTGTRSTTAGSRPPTRASRRCCATPTAPARARASAPCTARTGTAPSPRTRSAAGS